MKKFGIFGAILSGMIGAVMYFLPPGISEQGVEFIKKHEAFSAYPYRDQGGVWTIGYGSTRYPDGTVVRGTDPAINKQQATELLEATLPPYAEAVDHSVLQPLTQSQYDALISFTYNVGVDAFKRSRLLQTINTDPNSHFVIIQFYKWVYVKGRISKGLLYRREKEIELYFDDSILFEDRPVAIEPNRPDDVGEI